LASEDDEEEYSDPMNSDPDVTTLTEDPEAGYYHLRAIWGRLRYDSAVTELTDFSGSLTTTRGAEIIRRVIRFEIGQDYIVPRTDRKLVEWVSQTSVHNDGIGLDIFIPRPEVSFDTTYITEVDPQNDTTIIIVVDTVVAEVEPVTVTFETAPYSHTFSLSDLDGLDTVVYLDDGNAVSFQGFKLNRRPCPRGFLSGVWGRNENGEGVFVGLWMNRIGTLAGYVRGHYGENDNGDNVFYGKWISLSGRFEGFIKGTYGIHPSVNASEIAVGRAAGWFAGHIFSADGAEIGALKGRYRAARRHSNGYMAGRWRIYCHSPEDLSDSNDKL